MGRAKTRRRKQNADQKPPTVSGETRVDARGERKETKQDYKLDKTALKTDLIRAKSQRLKWLAVVIGLGLVAYFALSGGGLSILTKAKTLIGI